LAKLIKRIQSRIEFGTWFDTFLSRPETSVADIPLIRSRSDIVLDPELASAVRNAVAAATEGRAGGALMPLLAVPLIKSLTTSFAFGDIKSILVPFVATKMPDSEVAEMIKRRPDSNRVGMWLCTRPWMEMVSHAFRQLRERDQNELRALLIAAQMSLTLISKDIEEIGAFHVRYANGLGVSVNLDRVVPFPTILSLVSNLLGRLPWGQSRR